MENLQLLMQTFADQTLQWVDNSPHVSAHQLDRAHTLLGLLGELTETITELRARVAQLEAPRPGC